MEKLKQFSQKINVKSDITLIILLVIVVITLPLTLLYLRNTQNQQSLATATTVVSFSQASTQSAPIQATPNQALPLDVMVNPGTNLVSLLTVVISYDPAKFNVSQTNGFQVNTTSFPTTLEGPIYASGKVAIKISIGSDPTAAISQTVKVGTLNLIPIDGTVSSPTAVEFTSQTSALSIGPNDSATDNVIQSTVPAFISISGASTNPTSTPSLQNLPTATGSVISTTPIPTLPIGNQLTPTPIPLPTIAPTGSQPQPTTPITPLPTNVPGVGGGNTQGNEKKLGRIVAIILQNRAIIMQNIASSLEQNPNLTAEQKQAIIAAMNQFLEQFTQDANGANNSATGAQAVNHLKNGISHMLDGYTREIQRIQHLIDGLQPLLVQKQNQGTDTTAVQTQLTDITTQLAAATAAIDQAKTAAQATNDPAQIKQTLIPIRQQLKQLKKSLQSIKQSLQQAKGHIHQWHQLTPHPTNSHAASPSAATTPPVAITP